MATTQDTYNGNGSNLGPFLFTFKWLESTDIKVSVGGVLKTAGTHYNLQNLNYNPLTGKTGGEVLFTAGNAPPVGTNNIRIYRDTDDEALSAVFSSGSAIRAKDLNDNFTQNLYVTQEINNNALNVDGSNPMVGPLNMNGFQITNLPVPAVDTNAATKKYVDDRFGNLDVPGHTRWRKVATASQTTFSGTGDYGGVLAYSPTREQVYINGALQQRSVDYAADNGTSVVFTVGLTVGDVVDIICVNNLTNSSVSNAGNITYSGQFTGQTARTVAAKLSDVISVKDFGVVGDGVADDTAALTAAMSHCRSVNKILLVEGNVILNAASVPGGTSYINGCSMRGNGSSTITINGFVGFNMQGVNDTIVENLRIVTNNRQRTESSNPGTNVSIFNTASGTKNSAVYRNLTVVNNVTSTTGEYRADPAISEYGCQQCLFDNITVTNASLALIVLSSSNILISGVTGANVQTNIYLSSVSNYRIQKCSLINTKQQADYWVGRTFSTPRIFNGMDNVLVENGDYGVIEGLVTEWAIERAAYIQSNNVKISNCIARNCGGYKTVGNSYTNQVVNTQINSCHLTLDNNFALTRGRGNLSLAEVYWVSNVIVDSCSITNTQPSMTSIVGVAIANIGGAGAKNIYIKNCTAINVSAFAKTDMASLTSAQVAALSPPGTLLAAENVVIEGCTYKSANIREFGALYTHRDLDASADAKATYATKTLTLINNTVSLATAGVDRDDWLFDLRYMDGVRSINNTVDKPFVNNGVFSTAITAPSQNIYMNEQGFWHNANPGALIANLANFNLLEKSSLKFTGYVTVTDTVATISTLNTVTGTPSAGFVTIEVTGKGYFNITTGASWAVQMCANALHYFGRVVSGVRTDQVGTPPVTLSVSATDIDIRGDLAPTVLYSTKLTKV